MTRSYVTQLIEHKDREVFLLGLWAITGFQQIPLKVPKHSRNPSTYNLRRRLSILVNAVTSFSNRPLVYVFYLGCIISFFAGIAALYLVVRRLFFGEYLAGWPSLIVSIWLLGGLTIFCLGILGVYLSKIFMETKPRPYTIIRRIYGRHKEGAE
jgi:putative glycosyltransferase